MKNPESIDRPVPEEPGHPSEKRGSIHRSFGDTGHSAVAATSNPPADAAESLESQAPFLTSLAQDHPRFAAEVRQALPGWSSSVDAYIGRSGVASEILKRIDYMSAAEEETFLAGVARDVRAMLSGDKRQEVVFLHAQNSRSGAACYRRMLEYLQPDERSRVRLQSQSPAIDRDREQARGSCVHYVFLDDCSNSGEQLDTVLFGGGVGGFRRLANTESKAAPPRQWWEVWKKTSAATSPVHLHVRVMRMADRPRAMLEELRQLAERNGVALHVDNQSSRMPLTSEALTALGMSVNQLPPHAREQFAEHHTSMGGTPTVLGFFHHKVPDNLPTILRAGSTPSPAFVPLFGMRNQKTVALDG